MSIATVVTRGYGSFGFITAVVLRGYSIGAAVSTAGGGDSDIRRQRWLEWARQRRQKRQETAQTPARGDVVARAPEPAVAVPKPVAVDGAALLAANLAAVRAAAEERARIAASVDAMRVEAEAAARAAAEQEDEEVALLLLGL